MSHTSETVLKLKDGNWECGECGGQFPNGAAIQQHFDVMRGREEAGELADMATMVSDAIEKAREEGVALAWGQWAEQCRGLAQKWRTDANHIGEWQSAVPKLKQAAQELDMLVDLMRGDEE